MTAISLSLLLSLWLNLLLLLLLLLLRDLLRPLLLLLLLSLALLLVSEACDCVIYCSQRSSPACASTRSKSSRLSSTISWRCHSRRPSSNSN